MIDDEPVGVIFTVTIQFKLDDEKKDKAKIGGVEGGVQGGVEGGVEGGVIGGIQGEIEKGILILTEEERPQLTKKVEPIYPESAKKNGISGEAALQVIVDIDGRIEKVRILKSIPELDDAAVEALKQWIYEPYLVDGKPVKVAFKVQIIFKLR